jgi:hypothetical protein
VSERKTTQTDKGGGKNLGGAPYKSHVALGFFNRPQVASITITTIAVTTTTILLLVLVLVLVLRLRRLRHD